jgi:uncharacterized phage-associated protein
VQIEQNQRDLNISEVKKLANLFDISIENFLEEIDDSPKVKIEQVKHKAKQKTSIRINIPQQKMDKFKEVFLYVVSKVGAKPNIGETVLYKLLYFIDFDYYEKYEEQLIGAKYIKNHFGPTPVEFIKITEQMEKSGDIRKIKDEYFKFPQRKYLPIIKPDIKGLSAREIKHIDEVLERLSDKNANELTELSHKDIPWITADNGKPLEYEAVFYRTSETSVRTYNDD